MGECVIYHPLRHPSFVFRQVIIILDIQCSVEFGQLRSTPVKAGPTPVNYGRIRSNSGQIWSNSGRIRFYSRRIRSNSRRIRSDSGQLRSSRSDSGKLRSNPVELRSNLVQLRSNPVRLPSNPVQLPSNPVQLRSGVQSNPVPDSICLYKVGFFCTTLLSELAVSRSERLRWSSLRWSLDTLVLYRVDGCILLIVVVVMVDRIAKMIYRLISVRRSFISLGI